MITKRSTKDVKISITLFISAALLGLFSIAFGAYVDHGLSNHVSQQTLSSLMTALRYNQLYSILAALLSLYANSAVKNRLVHLAAFFFIIGTLLFSGSIYSFALFTLPNILHLAPIGGFCLMFGWLILIIYGLTTMKNL